MRKPDRIPNPKQSYPAPNSLEEELAIAEFGPDVMAQALFMFGPENTGAAIAALCVALGTLYRMITPVADFYGSQEKFADACRVMIAESALDDDAGADRKC
jgi:hypothetical protein